MNEDGKFWLAALCVIGIVVLGSISLSTDYWKDHNKKIADMVASGTDPVAAMCAMQDDYGEMPVCLVLASKAIK